MYVYVILIRSHNQRDTLLTYHLHVMHVSKNHSNSIRCYICTAPPSLRAAPRAYRPCPPWLPRPNEDEPDESPALPCLGVPGWS